MSAEDTIEFIMTLRRRGVTDPKVLAAMESVPREKFLDGLFKPRAYEDVPLPIACGQTISQPTVVGKMTQALEISPRHKVLEIGTGSGYQAAILSKLARRVYTIERHKPLARRAESLFQELNLGNIVTLTGDGSLGLPAQAPFDRIILTAAAEDPPSPLWPSLRLAGLWCCRSANPTRCKNLLKLLNLRAD